MLVAELARAIIVMGVSGAGKTTLGRALAGALHYAFIEADELHSPANLVKMSASVPLDDADREPWLADVATALGRAAEAGAESPPARRSRGLIATSSEAAWDTAWHSFIRRARGWRSSGGWARERVISCRRASFKANSTHLSPPAKTRLA